MSGREYWVLTNDNRCEHPRHIYFPQWILIYGRQPGWWRAGEWPQNTDQQRLPDCTGRRRWAVSCLNRFPRLHRYHVIRAVLGRAWRSAALLSLGRIDYNPYENCYRNFEPEQLEDRELVQWAMNQNLPLQDHSEGTDAVPNDHTLDHPAFWDTYCNIITETSVHSPGFITEKTTKPLAAGQLWCLASGTDNAEILRNLGFDVMDQVWNQHDYLAQADWRLRMDQMLSQLDQIVDNLPDIWRATQSARQHNQQWLFGDELRRRVMEPLMQRQLITRP
jgi:hypothetical protein